MDWLVQIINSPNFLKVAITTLILVAIAWLLVKSGVLTIHTKYVSLGIAFVEEIGFYVLHLEFSPIKGPEGNIEYLIHLRKSAEPVQETQADKDAIKKLVEDSHTALDK